MSKTCRRPRLCLYETLTPMEFAIAVACTVGLIFFAMLATEKSRTARSTTKPRELGASSDLPQGRINCAYCEGSGQILKEFSAKGVHYCECGICGGRGHKSSDGLSNRACRRCSGSGRDAAD